MTTRDDLEWWLQTAGETDWIWAKTYADVAPHDYVVEGRTPGLTRDDFVRAARVIHTFGQPGSYYSNTNIYLEDAATGVKWWTMDADVVDTTLINRATTERLYGAQTAPDTRSGVVTAYDAIATNYDANHPTATGFADELRSIVQEHTGPYPPHVLDLACGTGRILDLGLASPNRYVGVDASTPMLNQLVRKHADVARLYPMDLETALSGGHFTERQFDVVTLLVSEVETFSESVLETAKALASRVFVHAVGQEITAHVRDAPTSEHTRR